MHKSLVPLAREALVGQEAAFNDLEKGRECYNEFAGYGKVAEVVTAAMLSVRSEQQAISRALETLKDDWKTNMNLEDYLVPVTWGIRQLETLLFASSSQPHASL